jgi:hypothetical protein
VTVRRCSEKLRVKEHQEEEQEEDQLKEVPVNHNPQQHQANVSAGVDTLKFKEYAKVLHLYI